VNEIKNLKLVIFVIFTFISIFLAGCVSNNVSWGDATDFTLTTVNGETFTLSDNIGNIIILDLMAAYCPPCIDQMVELEKIVNEFGESIVVVSVDVAQFETKDNVIETFGEYIDKWIFVMDSSSENVGSVYGADYIPKLVIIDKNGNIYYEHTGLLDYSTLSDKINEIL